MKKLYFVTLLIACLCLVSCKSDIEFGSSFDKSYSKWLVFKKQSGDSYAYTANTYSWTGTSTEMVTTVMEGKITRRSFTVNGRNKDGEIVRLDEFCWIEEGSEIGTHAGSIGLMTLGDIYDKARAEWLVTRSDAQTYFETENDGMISLCGYVPNGCQDDCFRGVRISSIEAILK